MITFLFEVCQLRFEPYAKSLILDHGGCFYRGERRDVKSFTPEEHQDYLDKKQHTINEAKEAIAGMKARIAELERIQAMNPIRRWFYQKFHI